MNCRYINCNCVTLGDISLFYPNFLGGDCSFQIHAMHTLKEHEVYPIVYKVPNNVTEITPGNVLL